MTYIPFQVIWDSQAKTRSPPILVAYCQSECIWSWLFTLNHGITNKDWLTFNPSSVLKTYLVWLLHFTREIIGYLPFLWYLIYFAVIAFLTNIIW